MSLIQVYYTKLFDPYKPDQSVYQEEIKVSADIASTLLVCTQLIATFDVSLFLLLAAFSRCYDDQ